MARFMPQRGLGLSKSSTVPPILTGQSPEQLHRAMQPSQSGLLTTIMERSRARRSMSITKRPLSHSKWPKKNDFDSGSPRRHTSKQAVTSPSGVTLRGSWATPQKLKNGTPRRAAEYRSLAPRLLA